jgi:hypothetical protein
MDRPVDYARGIDIVSFDRTAPLPAQAELDQAWLTNLGVVGEFSGTVRLPADGAHHGIGMGDTNSGAIEETLRSR